MSNPTRILSFDGGGIRGIFQAAFLSYIEDVSLLPGIDLLAGTSTGAIIAVALSLGIKPKELVTFYESLGQEIFRKKTFWVKSHFLGHTSFSSDILKAQLEKNFAGQKLGDCMKRVLIPAVSLNSWSPYVFDSANPQDAELSVIDVLLATTAAPTYFKPHYIAANRTTWVDGGLVCNNPSFEALYRTNKQFENGLVRILSMGNGQHPVSSLPSSYAKKIPLKWAVNLTEICMNATSEDAHARCTQLLHEDDYIRINAVLGDKIALHDCTKAFEILPALAHKQAKENRPKIIDWLT